MSNVKIIRKTDDSLLTRHIGEDGNIHLQLSVKDDAQKAGACKSIVDVCFNTVTQELESANLYLQTTEGNSTFRHASAQAGAGVPQDNVRFFTKVLGKEHKDFLGMPEGTAYATGLSDYPLVDDDQYPSLKMAGEILELLKAKGHVSQKMLAEVSAALPELENHIPKQEFKLPAENQHMRVSMLAVEDAQRSLLATVANKDAKSPIAAVMIYAHNVRDKKSGVANRDAVGYLDFFYVPREGLKRGNFTGHADLDAYFNSVGPQGTAHRGLGPSVTSGHSEFIAKAGGSKQIDVAAADPEQNKELYAQLRKKRLIHPDTDKDIEAVIHAINRGLLYTGERKWTDVTPSAAAAPAGRIIIVR